MSDAAFTHDADRCSFETLVLRGKPAEDSALVAIGEMIHDLGIGDTKLDRPETYRLGAILSGMCASTVIDPLLPLIVILLSPRCRRSAILADVEQILPFPA